MLNIFVRDIYIYIYVYIYIYIYIHIYSIRDIYIAQPEFIVLIAMYLVMTYDLSSLLRCHSQHLLAAILNSQDLVIITTRDNPQDLASDTLLSDLPVNPPHSEPRLVR